MSRNLGCPQGDTDDSGNYGDNNKSVFEKEAYFKSGR